MSHLNEFLRVAILNDYGKSGTRLRPLVPNNPDWQIIWETDENDLAVEKCRQEKPDLLLMDFFMAGKSDVQVIRTIMAIVPCAILVVTSDLKEQAPVVFNALAAGALDAVDLPAGRVDAHPQILARKMNSIAQLLADKQHHAWTFSTNQLPRDKQDTLVAIGASAGGPAALCQLLEQLPVDFPAAVVVIQHLDEQYASGMAEWLTSSSRIPVSVAKEGDRPMPGQILLAGSNNHLVFDENGCLTYQKEPIGQIYRPSIDEFYASAALCWSGPIIGVLLSGMGQDGARGMLALYRLGHITFAQDIASSVVYGMPGTAARFGGVKKEMNPASIGKELVRLLITNENQP